MSHYHRRWRECADTYCPDRDRSGDVEGCLIPFGPLSGCSALAAELMRHYEVNPDDHPEALAELEQAIGEAMLDTGQDVLRERGIAYPGFDPVAEGVAG